MPSRPMCSRCWRPGLGGPRVPPSRTASTAVHSCWRRSRPLLGRIGHRPQGGRGTGAWTAAPGAALLDALRRASGDPRGDGSWSEQRGDRDDPAPDEARRREHINAGSPNSIPALGGRQPSRARGPPVPRGHRPRTPTLRRRLTPQGSIATYDPAEHAYSVPGSDVALRPPPRAAATPAATRGSTSCRRPDGTGPPRRRHSSSTQPLRPASDGPGDVYGALIAAMTTSRASRSTGHRAPAVAGAPTLSLYSATTLDTLPTPGLDAPGRSHRRRARRRPSGPAVLPRGPAPRSGGAQGRRRDRRGIGPRLRRAAGRRRAPARFCRRHIATTHARATRCGILRAGATISDTLAVASSSVTAGALIAVAVALTIRMRTASSISRRTTSPILVAVLAVAGTSLPQPSAGRRRRAGDARAARLVLDRDQPDDPGRILAGMLGARVFPAARSNGSSPVSAPAPSAPMPAACSGRAGRPVAHGRLLACAAQRVRRHERHPVPPPQVPRADPRPSSVRTAVRWP